MRFVVPVDSPTPEHRIGAMHDVVGLRLYVERENTRAQATYRRLGMRETSYLLYEETFRASSAI